MVSPGRGYVKRRKDRPGNLRRYSLILDFEDSFDAFKN
jgi:hypothetical protein